MYEKVGFVHEGTKRQALRWDEDWVDVDLMAMLDRDWSARGRPSVGATVDG